MARALVATFVLTACGTGARYQPSPDVSMATLPTIATPSSSTVAPIRASRSRSRHVVSALPATGATGDLLDRLAMCESGMRRVTGGAFHSYFQWMLSTWHSLSGLSGPPEDYDYATQKAVAARIPLSAYHRQFPVCSRRLGV